MKLLLLAFLLFSCAPVKVEKKKEIPVYLAPVSGERLKEGRGLFIRTRCGKFFRAVEGGKVVYVGKDVENFGWVIVVEQWDGFVSVYGKVKKPWVKTGERVKPRQVLGRVGRTRRRCGLYFELRDPVGNPVRPVLR